MRGIHLGSVSSVLLEAGWLAGSGGSARTLISITSRCCCCRHCLLWCPSTLLSSSSSSIHHRPTSAVEPINTTLPFNSKSPSVSVLLYTPSISLCFSFYPLLFHKLTCSYRDVADADSAGFVMNGILLDIRRKYTFQCGFTNCLHCPGNDSLNAAENGSQPDSQKDRQHSANRMARLQNLQTARGKQTERQIGCDRYSHPTTVADNTPIATSGYSHKMKEKGNTGNRVWDLCFHPGIFVL